MIDSKTMIAQMQPNKTQLKNISEMAASSGMELLPSMPDTANKVFAEESYPDAMVHFLNRTSYGFTNEELAFAQSIGLDAYLDYQLAWDEFDTSEIDAIISNALPSLSMTYAEVIERVRNDDDFNPAFEVIAATLLRAAYNPNQLYEIMVEFWSNHFNVNIFDGTIQVLKGIDDRYNIRPHALGNFKDLLHANAKSPAMLFYLNGVSNTADGPNENYARELMELHTLGVNGGYTEADVKEVARCFTGWTITEQAEGLFYFAAGNHDFGSKQVLELSISAGGGIEDGEQVLDMLANHPSTAVFIAKKLCKRFISDEPPQAAIDAVALTFMNTDGDIKACLKTLFNSTDFTASVGVKFKRPIEYVISMFRTTQPVSSSRVFEFLYRQVSNLGQLPFAFPAPTGFSDETSGWLNSNALLDRWNLGFAVGYGDLSLGRNDAFLGDNDRYSVAADFVQLPVIQKLGSARTPAAIADSMLGYILHQEINQNDRDALVELAANGVATTQPLSLEQAVVSARAVIAALLASRHFQQR